MHLSFCSIRYTKFLFHYLLKEKSEISFFIENSFLMIQSFCELLDLDFLYIIHCSKNVD